MSSPLLAIAEWKNKSGIDLIEAVVIEYEVCYRIGEAESPSHYFYWHYMATCGTFGAATAAAKLLELNTEQIIHTQEHKPLDFGSLSRMGR